MTNDDAPQQDPPAGARAAQGKIVTTERMVVLVAVLCGVFVGLIDTLLDYFVFHEGTFLELAITGIPRHEIYVRTVILVTFAAFGLIVSRVMSKRRRADEALRRAHDELERRVLRRTTRLAEANELLRAEIAVRERVEEELAIFRRFTDTSGEGLGMAELDGTICYANATLCRFLGEAKPEDALGKKVTNYYVEEDIPRLQQEILPAVIDRGYQTVEIPLLSVDGKTTPAIQSIFLIRDDRGKPFRLANVITDITQRKQIEDALRQSHEELQAIDEGMVDGLLIADVATMRLVRANSAISKMLGFSEDELLSMSVADIHRSDDLPDVLKSFHALAEGEISVAENTPVLRKDGSVFYADITASHIIYDGEPCMVGFFRDITERKRAQEALQKEHEVLRQLLKSQERERRLIAYEIHDGLAQQLVATIMQLESYRLLKDSEPETASQTYDAGIEMLRQSVAEVRRLISGLRPPVLDESGIVAAVEHLVEDTRDREDAEVAFRSQVEFDRLDPVLENAVYRIVQECMTNALRHSGSKTVQIEMTQNDGRLRIEVTDEGSGFDPEVVGEECYGLKGIKERARLLGGHADIQSTPGQGTRVTVDLPLTTSE